MIISEELSGKAIAVDEIVEEVEHAINLRNQH